MRRARVFVAMLGLALATLLPSKSAGDGSCTVRVYYAYTGTYCSSPDSGGCLQQVYYCGSDEPAGDPPVEDPDHCAPWDFCLSLPPLTIPQKCGGAWRA